VQYPKNTKILEHPLIEEFINMDRVNTEYATLPKNVISRPIKLQMLHESINAVLARRMLEAAESGDKITQKALSEELNMSFQNVSKRLQQIRKQWRESPIRDWNELTELKLAELEFLKQEALDAWYRSQENAVAYKESSDNHGGKQETTVKGQVGDVKFLAEINRCIAQEIDLLGLKPPQEIQIKTWEDKVVDYLKDGRITIEDLSEQLGKKKAELLGKRAGLLSSGE